MPTYERTNAVRRAAADRELANLRRARLTASICSIATQQADNAEGDHFVLAENLGPAHKPLWVYLGTKPQHDGQPELVMTGNGQPVWFAEAHVVELTPLLYLYMGNLEFIPASQVCARYLTKLH